MDAYGETTLRRLAGNDGVGKLIAQYPSNQAAIADEVGQGGSHTEALRTLADFLSTRDQADQRIRALYLISSHFGDSDEYLPGEAQVTLFGRLGTDGGAPLPDATLSELVGVAVEDLMTHNSGAAQTLRQERDAALARIEAAEQAQAVAEAATEELEALRVEVAEVRATLATKDGQIAHLQAMLSGSDREPKGEPRRRRLPGHTGIYYRQTADGKTFEITWREGGRQRWRTVGTDLDEAIAARAALTEEVAA